MSVIKRIIEDSKEKLKVDELLADEFESAGYGGITLTKTPLGAQINLFTMRPGRVIGKRGRSIKAASSRLEEELGLENPQITVVEVEIPELNPRIMAARIANALERGIHYRRAIFWSLRRIMESGAIGCEIVVNGPLRSARGRYEKVSEGYIPKSGDPALRYIRKATIHVKMKRGTVGVNVTIVPPESKFPDKIGIEDLPEIEYTEEDIKAYEGPYEEDEEPLVKPEPIVDTDISEVEQSISQESHSTEDTQDQVEETDISFEARSSETDTVEQKAKTNNKNESPKGSEKIIQSIDDTQDQTENEKAEEIDTDSEKEEE